MRFLKHRKWRGPLLAGAVALALAAGLTQFNGQDKPDKFGGPDRYLAHISTDKPIYRPGETLYLRTTLLQAFDHSPLKRHTAAQLKVTNARGATVMESRFDINASVGGGSWTIPQNLPGGEYTATVSFPWEGFAPAVRKFDVRNYRAPRIKTQLEFLRKAYGPGDRVSAVMKAERAEGGIPAGAKVTAVARLDGAEVWRGNTTVNDEGNCSVSFELPGKIDKGVGSLALVVQDGGVVETASKTLPILLQKIPMTFCPEGGDLVAGLECGLYFEAKTPWGDPADVSGEIVDAGGAAVADFSTLHEGRGRVRFTPAAGKQYFAKIDKPAGITKRVALPEVKVEGASLRAEQPCYGTKDSLSFHVAATTAGAYKLVVSQRENETAAVSLNLKANEPQLVLLSPDKPVDGVLRATLFDADDKPLAERLVFRRPADALKIEITASPEHAVPGDKVELTVHTTTSKGEPVPATVGLTVTDDSVLQMIEKRKQAPRLPVMALLEDEVDHLEDAQIYFGNGPEAAEDIDLLLGTQGWRRFAYVHPDQFRKKYGDKAKRALAFRVEPFPRRGEAVGLGGGIGGGGRDKGEPTPDDAPRTAAKDEVNDRQAPEAGEPKPQELPAGEVEEKNAMRRLGKEREQEGARLRPARALVAVREYAHQLRKDRKPGDRKDFTETLYWNAGVRTDKRGEAKVSFYLSDSVTGFRVMADGFTDTGALGEADAIVTSRQPFYVEPKLPLEVTAGDVVMLPVNLVNSTAGGMKVVLQASAGEALSIPADFDGKLDLKADERGRLLLPVHVGRANGKVTLTLDGKAGAFSDRVTREIAVRPLGFPMSYTSGGMLEKPQAINLTIPDDVYPTSITTSVKVYPTPAANLISAMKTLIREPHGCFEQTSSTSYPLVMAQQYFTLHPDTDPALIANANKMLDKSYKRLIGFECKAGGYEWFGHGAGHESLTAYGVLQFEDMAKVYPVDKEMLARTKAWLLSRENDEGGFHINPHFLHSWGCPQYIADAYIIWSLTESGDRNLDQQINAMLRRTDELDDPYYNALAALSLFNVDRTEEAQKLLAKIVKHQQDNGSVLDSKTTVVASRGDSLRIETSAVAALAWMRDKDYAGNVEKAMQWLTTRCKDGRFGSTQSTVLALKAIVAYDKLRSKPKAAGTLILVVDGKELGKLPFTEKTTGTLELPGFASMMKPGKHRVELRMEDGSPMPYSFDVSYYSTRPANSPECKLNLAVSLAGDEVKEGESTEVNVTLTNTDAKLGQNNAMAIVGLPGGLEPRVEKLKELVKQGTIDSYEVTGRNVVFYFTQMQPGQKISFSFDTIAAVPGQYKGQASQAYCYYADEYRNWTDGLSVKITPR